MNRDEADARVEAGEHIERHSNNHLKQWWPIDSVSLGTWFGLRGDGFVAALLNRYQGRSAIPVTSRGVIIPTLFTQTQTNAGQWIADQSWEPFASFDLVLVHNNSITQYSWDDGAMQMQEHNARTPFFLSSSSSDYEKSIEVRHAAFERFKQKHHAFDAVQILEDLHQKVDINNPELSFVMRRPGRRTKSIVQAMASSVSPWHRYIPLT